MPKANGKKSVDFVRTEGASFPDAAKELFLVCTGKTAADGFNDSDVPAIRKAIERIQASPEKVLSYDTARINALLQEIDRLKASSEDTETIQLKSERQMWIDEITRLTPFEKKSVEVEKKYNELLATVEAYTRARVAADAVTSHTD